MKDIIYCPDCLKGYSECNCAPASPVLEDASGLKRHIGSLNEHVATLRARVAELERERDAAIEVHDTACRFIAEATAERDAARRELERERDDKDETIAWLSDMLRTVNELHRAEFQARENAEAEREAAIEVHDTACRFIAEATAERDAVRRELEEVRGRLKQAADDVEHYGGWGWREIAKTYRDILAAIEPEGDHGPACKCGHPEHAHLMRPAPGYEMGCQVCDCKSFEPKE